MACCLFNGHHTAAALFHFSIYMESFSFLDIRPEVSPVGLSTVVLNPELCDINARFVQTRLRNASAPFLQMCQFIFEIQYWSCLGRRDGDEFSRKNLEVARKTATHGCKNNFGSALLSSPDSLIYILSLCTSPTLRSIHSRFEHHGSRQGYSS
jgi:hypothetical protein